MDVWMTSIALQALDMVRFTPRKIVGEGWDDIWSNEIATSHDLGPQKVAEEGKSPSFRDI